MDKLLALAYRIFKFIPAARPALISIRLMFQLSKVGIRVNDLSEAESLQIISLSKMACKEDPPIYLTVLYMTILSLLENPARSVFRVSLREGLYPIYNFVEINKEEQGLGIATLEAVAIHELRILESAELSQADKSHAKEMLENFNTMVINLRVLRETTFGPAVASSDGKIELSNEFISKLLKK